MALVSWPVELPDCPQTWSEQDMPDIIKTEMDTGHPKVRLRSAVKKRMVNVTWTLPINLKSIFLEFYETDCLSGVNSFQFKDPGTNEMQTFQFDQPPNITYIPKTNGVGSFRVDCAWRLVS